MMKICHFLCNHTRSLTPCPPSAPSAPAAPVALEPEERSHGLPGMEWNGGQWTAHADTDSQTSVVVPLSDVPPYMVPISTAIEEADASEEATIVCSGKGELPQQVAPVVKGEEEAIPVSHGEDENAEIGEIAVDEVVEKLQGLQQQQSNNNFRRRARTTLDTPPPESLLLKML